MSARNFFNVAEIEHIKVAIQSAELDTSGEIRIHIENNCPGEVLDRAAQVFKLLNMQKTELRNGVLIYLAVKNRKFAIIGDKGINAVVEEDYWELLKARMLESFRQNKFADGLADTVKDIGRKLKVHFPFKSDDKNELPDDVSFGE
jgi:uncharacterized membrane protein